MYQNGLKFIAETLYMLYKKHELYEIFQDLENFE